MSLKNPSVLAFERKLCNSDALMLSGLWQKRNIPNSWTPLKLQQKDVRGTISNRLKDKLANDPLKLDAEIQKANLQSVDVAALPFDADTLKVVFTLRVLGNVALPCVCNEPVYQEALTNKVGAYLKSESLKSLALRYAENLVNGRILWRNRIGAEAIEVVVSHRVDGEVKQSWTFNSCDFNLHTFSGEKNAEIEEIADLFVNALTNQMELFFEIETFARMGVGQEVYPSQELTIDHNPNSKDKSKKSKILYAVNGIAGMHSQKIGNALRTIDTWYPKAMEFGPIAAEPYGSVTSRGVAYRQPKEKMDFYSLLDAWILKDKTPSIEQQHYVVACLIRGGVFGEKEEK